MTRIKAGPSPLNKAIAPSVLRMCSTVCKNPMRLERAVEGKPGFERTTLTVCRVLTTQIGFVRTAVMVPAMAPASMDSIVDKDRFVWLEDRNSNTARDSSKKR